MHATPRTLYAVWTGALFVADGLVLSSQRVGDHVISTPAGPKEPMSGAMSVAVEATMHAIVDTEALAAAVVAAVEVEEAVEDAGKTIQLSIDALLFWKFVL